MPRDQNLNGAVGTRYTKEDIRERNEALERIRQHLGQAAMNAVLADKKLLGQMVRNEILSGAVTGLPAINSAFPRSANSVATHCDRNKYSIGVAGTEVMDTSNRVLRSRTIAEQNMMQARNETHRVRAEKQQALAAMRATHRAEENRLEAEISDLDNKVDDLDNKLADEKARADNEHAAKLRETERADKAEALLKEEIEKREQAEAEAAAEKEDKKKAELRARLQTVQAKRYKVSSDRATGDKRTLDRGQHRGGGRRGREARVPDGHPPARQRGRLVQLLAPRQPHNRRLSDGCRVSRPFGFGARALA